ncbi:MAG: undecaprenyldiphospho-muramoylpentapeptide beta-N-acetylglucosaminyltransferase [Fimbriimonadaceae bacterium]|nr:undecaprenyldiphospho-muramoylpentapeptide beta-N-acetylglucosaminyltransferase [Fimbriimonadaceae bacterium]QYK55281.1 MAG: undecaprenyldiphospho-muramoylpentapeptide beta-N-acetylglucosaminyltransferase [Fimbriimonadaceae bacterium]
MKLVMTGGGTGGHVFPALEVARAAQDRGASVRYFGSHRGIEGAQCAKVGLPFEGFASEPVYSLTRLRGWRSIVRLLRASGKCARALERERPDCVFATGGYSSAPVLSAAKRLGVPLVLHEQNSVPGRTLRLAAPSAHRVCLVFDGAAKFFPQGRTVRTGMPIRRELRDSAQGRLPTTHSLESAAPIVLVMGGSQGSLALNDVSLAAAVRIAKDELQWLHLTGLSHFESTMETLRKMPVKAPYSVKAYLDADEMACAYFSSAVAVCRAGAGTLSELAAFRKPAILVPYPRAFGDHQRKNAEEFAAMGAADVLTQDNLSASSLEIRLYSWIHDRERVLAAERALAEWDVPDATEQILDIVWEAGAAP